jgi:hypothetical protein
MQENFPVAFSFFPASQYNGRDKKTHKEQKEWKYLVIKKETFPSCMFHIFGNGFSNRIRPHLCKAGKDPFPADYEKHSKTPESINRDKSMTRRLKSVAPRLSGR